MDDFSKKDPYGFYFQLSGQIRLPLTTIQTALKKLAPSEEREKNPVLDENAALLQKGIFQLMRLAINLSDASELGDDTPPPMETIDLYAFCKELSEELASIGELSGHKILFHYEGEEEMPLSTVSRHGMRRLLLNLFSNAFKFTPAGGTITLTLAVKPDTVSMIVSDTGCGIKAELLPTLFDRYHHTDRVDPAAHGLGLGLPICHHIARQHDGTLSAVSMENVGTQVIFTFKRKESNTLTIKAPMFHYTGGYHPLLVELSDALPKKAFTIRNLD